MNASLSEANTPSSAGPGRLPRRAGYKYTEIIVSIILFIILDVGVLALNYVTSYRLAADAVSINLCARQRMLCQRMSKALLQLDFAALGDESIESARKEVQLTHDLFDTSLTAFAQSGTVIGGEGKPVFLPAVETPAGQEIVHKMQALWNPFKEALQPVLAARDRIDQATLDPAVKYMTAHNLELLAMANSLTTELVDNADRRAGFMRTVQATAMVLVLLNFSLTIFHFLRKLRRYDAQIESVNQGLQSSNEALAATTGQLVQAKQESDLILSTVRQGMFLVAADGTIGDQHSAELTEIFQTEHLAGYNFLQVLQRTVSEKTFRTTRDYFAMLFDPAKKEKLLAKINPLARVEVNFSRPEGGFTTKHLEFAFRRILAAEGGAAERVFVSVRDITQQVELEERLKQSEQKKERQFEILLGILHVGPADLKEFITMVEGELQKINETLKAEDFIAAAAGAKQSAVLRDRLGQVFRSVHNIKGNADYLKLDHFGKAAHAFEDVLMELNKRPRLAGDDFLSVAIHQAHLRNDLAEIRELAGKLGDLRQSITPAGAAVQDGAAFPRPLNTQRKPAASATADDGPFAWLSAHAAKLAARLGKEVEVQVADFHGSAPPPDTHAVMRDILIQLTRNSMVHGVELPAERAVHGKPRCGLISVAPVARLEPGFASGFVFRDDGRGLDANRIRRRAIERGLLSEQAARALDDDEAVLLIFRHGFSTAEEMTGDAGRGVGLDLVKERVIDDLGGEILVESEAGRFCEFTFLLPARPASNGAREGSHRLLALAAV